MFKILRIRRRVYFILFLIIFPFLQVSALPCWQFEGISTGHCLYRSAKISYPAENPVTGISLHLTKTSCGIRTTLCVNCLKTPPYQGNSHQAIVSLRIAGEQSNWIAERMEGGQELLLPDLATECLIQAFSACQDVHILLDGYEALVAAKNFNKLWKKLARICNCSFVTQDFALNSTP